MTDAGRFLKWAMSVRNTPEGSARQRRWNAAAGVAATAAWCSTFIAYGLKLVGINPPSEPAYSGAWLDWSEGEKVEGGLAKARPGDLLIFDWGDGGITDHVGAYIGGNRYIAGNNSNNSVGISPVPAGNIVGVVRPKKFAGTDYGGGPLGFAKEFVLGDPLEALDIGSGQDLKDSLLPDAAGIAGDVVEQLGKMLGVNAPAILLNVGLVGGGAFLIFYGISKAAGVSAPAGRVLGAAARGPAAAAVPGGGS